MRRGEDPARPRITGGSLRSRPLPEAVPEGVRPTASRVREALFNVVGQQLAGWSVLDGCGGTGLLAFEAWSRGSRSVDVAEPVAARAAAIQRGADRLGCGVAVRRGAVERLLRPGAAWDLVLLDPPYDADPAALAALAAPHARRALVVEHRADVLLPDRIGALGRDRLRRYGLSALSVYRPGPGARAPASAAPDEVVGDDAVVVEDEP